MLQKLMPLALALATSSAVHAAGANNDEAWLQRAMAAPMAPGVPVPAERMRRVEFPALAALGGHRARVDTVDGGNIRGLIERAEADTLVLRVLRSSGHDTVTLARADVRAIWID